MCWHALGSYSQAYCSGDSLFSFCIIQIVGYDWCLSIQSSGVMLWGLTARLTVQVTVCSCSVLYRLWVMTGVCPYSLHTRSSAHAARLL